MGLAVGLNAAVMGIPRHLTSPGPDIMITYARKHKALCQPTEASLPQEASKSKFASQRQVSGDSTDPIVSDQAAKIKMSIFKPGMPGLHNTSAMDASVLHQFLTPPKAVLLAGSPFEEDVLKKPASKQASLGLKTCSLKMPAALVHDTSSILAEMPSFFSLAGDCGAVGSISHGTQDDGMSTLPSAQEAVLDLKGLIYRMEPMELASTMLVVKLPAARGKGTEGVVEHVFNAFSRAVAKEPTDDMLPAREDSDYDPITDDANMPCKPKPLSSTAKPGRSMSKKKKKPARVSRHVGTTAKWATFHKVTTLHVPVKGNKRSRT
ncbi:hypothetical protein WJX84_003592 [Apatococcus fuscideae]|uniref:Uncharacterized protein n=1 Tax=Apatococcus fuscideae TaxID=2026836 RepID=A0AAW1TEH1_9CHLO